MTPALEVDRGDESHYVKVTTGQPRTIKFAVKFQTQTRPVSRSRCDASFRRCHEFRADRIGDGLAQDLVDLGLGSCIERPASHLVDRLQLIGTTRAPQCRGDALVEHPADRQMNNALAETLREAID